MLVEQPGRERDCKGFSGDMARAADIMRYNTLLGVKGINVRNTFIEFEEEDSYGDFDGRTGFGRQASEPAKPSSWNRQVSEQTTAITAEGTEESAIDVEDTMHLSPSDFQIQGHVPGEMLAHASRMGSDVAFLDAIKAVNQAVSNMTQMTQGAASTMPVNPPKPQLRFCPSCGAKVLSQAHRFCAYCCFPFGQLQDETVPPPAQQTSLLSSSPMPSSMGAVEQALLANMQAAAPMPSQPVMPGKVSKTSKANKSPQPDNGGLLSNLRHFRYMEANQLDVELARVLCLTHIRDSIQVAA